MKIKIEKDEIIMLYAMIEYAYKGMDTEGFEADEIMIRIRNGILSGEKIEWEEK